MQLMGCISHTDIDTYANIMMNRKKETLVSSPMEQMAAQVFSQQEWEQKTRDLKQQDGESNALTEDVGNAAVLPTGHTDPHLHLFYSSIFFRNRGEERTQMHDTNHKKNKQKTKQNRKSAVIRMIAKILKERAEFKKTQNYTKKKIHNKQKVNHRTTNGKQNRLADREETHRTTCTQSTN